ncbi:AAA family ATPase [Lysinibacter cavernae]|uniref:AAA family ATPase n=1 Tax=Lysinibacter cavernae TaxID=1640652 RepID=UPI0036194837
MSTYAYVLMTAMPPTLGHLDLIRFAHALTPHTTVIVATQPGEPYTRERVATLNDAVKDLAGVRVAHIHKTLPQEPEGHEGFWDMWVELLTTHGFEKGDYIVASEDYGRTLAEHAGGVFMPYDLDRSIRYTKATDVRRNPSKHFDQMLPEFRKLFQRRITLFGAESVGKTTMSKALPGHTLFEWARPYLEQVGAEVTTQKMNRIWHGQRALQDSADYYRGEHIIQDTDLFSTLGYWEMYSPDTVPVGLELDAQQRRSDLYVILGSTIPFEPDQLRYGGDIRETTDAYWIYLCEKHNLQYVYITESELHLRELAVRSAIADRLPAPELWFLREGSEYLSN